MNEAAGTVVTLLFILIFAGLLLGAGWLFTFLAFNLGISS